MRCILLSIRTSYFTYLGDAYFCSYELFTIRTYAIRTFWPLRTFAHRHFVYSHVANVPYLHLQYVLLSVTYICPYLLTLPTDIVTYLRMYITRYVRTFAIRTFVRDVHLSIRTIYLTYICPYVLYTLRTFAVRTFIRDVHLSIRTLYRTYICDTYFCP